MDDILAGARTVSKLERRLKRLFNVCRKKNMKLNPRKFKVGVSGVFGGCVISHDITSGISLTPEDHKVAAVKNLQAPRNRTEVQRLVGFLNQLSGWVPHLQMKIPGLKRLTSAANKFIWNPDLEAEFLHAKQLLDDIIALSPLNTDLIRGPHRCLQRADRVRLDTVVP